MVKPLWLPLLFVNGEDDDATRDCCKVNRTDVYTVCGGLAHFRKPDFLNIVKTNIPLKFKENMINLYLYYFNCWFTQSTSEIHWKTLIGHRTCAKYNCAI
jgi:hypothetical protein